MSNKPLLIVGADFVKSQIAAFTRKDGAFVAAHSDKRVAASKAPPIGHHAKALRESSKPGDMDHWHNQVASDHMAAGDHKALGATLRSMDTAARDHVLEHIHPDHHAGLGFETINHARSVAGYDKKFPAAKPKAAKPAKAKEVGDDVYFPHPDKPGKKAMGTVVGHKDGQAVVKHTGSDRTFAHDHADLKVQHSAASKTAMTAKPSQETVDALKQGLQQSGMAAKGSGNEAGAAPSPSVSAKKFQVRDNAGNVHKVFHGDNAEHEAGQHMRALNQKGGRFSTRDVTPKSGSMEKSMLVVRPDLLK